MSRRVGAVAAVCVVLLLAGCGSAPQAVALHEADYLKLSRGNVPEVRDWSDAKLDAVGKSACASVRSGGKADMAGWVQSVKVLTTSGFTGGDAGKFIAFTVARFCPELKSYLPES